MSKFIAFITTIFLSVFAISGIRGELERVDIAVTAYNVNLAVIKDTRRIELEEGVNWVKFTDVAALIDPTSVHLTFAGDSALTINEQNFDYDKVSDAKLLNKYLGEYIAIMDKDGERYKGELLFGAKANFDEEGKINYFMQDVVIKEKSGSLFIIPEDNIADIRFPLLPSGLVTKPTLNWKITSKDKGAVDCEIAYMTKGMNWRADYVLLLKRDEPNIDLSGVVTIDNRTGATYDNTQLKLVAGDVHLVEEEKPKRPRKVVLHQEKYSLFSSGAQKPQFKEKSFFEYHLYTLQRRATLKDNQTKQIEFVNAMDIPAERIYVYDGSLLPRGSDSYNPYYGTQTNKKVHVYLEFKNSKENNLGIPLPKGKIRLNERDNDGKEQYLGEDTIKHIPKNEKLLIRVGVAFDLIGERKQTSFTRDDKAFNTFWESVEITLRNHKKKDVTIRVVEHLYRFAEWEILEQSDPFLKLDSKNIEFRIKVPAEGERVVTYRVKYRGK